MKLLKCHIENFGKLHNFDYTFGSGLNNICEENGYGKTTFAAFIKAMFYGMASYTDSTTRFPDRKHYLPFGGGKYGGSLTFSMDGAEYRIERAFDKKSESRDVVNVFRNNAGYTGFGGDIGMKVFGIDRDSFERTVFIDSRAVDSGTSDSISAKLGGIAGGTDGDKTVTAAALALEKAAKRYKLERGQGGKIYELDRRITSLLRDIRDAEDTAAALDGKYTQYNALRGEIDGLEEQKKRLGKAEVVASQWKTYDTFAGQEQAALQEYKALVGAYPRGIPSDDEIKQLKNYSADIERSKNAMDIKAFGGEQMRRLESLKEQFSCGVPVEDELDEADKKAVRCQMLESEIAALKNTPQDVRLKEFERRFDRGVPDSGTMQQYEKKIEDLREVDSQINARMTAGRMAAAQTSQGKKGVKWHIVAGVIAVLLIIGGAALMIYNMIAGGAVAGIGALFLIISVALYFGGRKGASDSTPVNIDDALADMQYKKNKYIDELRAFLTAYGYYSGSAESDFAQCKNDLSLYAELKGRSLQTAKEIAAKTEELESKRAEADKLLAAYGLTNGDMQAGLRNLRALAEEYKRLCAAQRQSADDVRSAGNRINESYKGVNAILAKYGIELSGELNVLIEVLERVSRDLARLKSEIEQKHSRAESYRMEKGLAERPVVTESGADMDKLSDLLTEKNGELAALAHGISLMEEKTERLDGLKDSLSEAQEELAAAEERHKLLSAAEELLEKAQQNLKDRYVSPVKDRFTYYAGKIEEALGQRVKMDGEFNVSFEQGGVITSEKYLSAGQRCVCALCFRLALIDNMYGEEQPFIIMDDPFVNLDEAHLKDAVKLVRALAKDRQIIYFCCHSSRKAS